SVRTRAKDEERLTRSAKDRHGLAEGGVAPFADRRSLGSAEPAARGDDGGEGAKGATERRSSATPPRPRHVVVTRRTISLEIFCRLAVGVSIFETGRSCSSMLDSTTIHRDFSLDLTLIAHESRILTPGGSAISPGGAGPPASPSPGHYHPPAHSPPLVKVNVGCFRRVSNDSYSWPPIQLYFHLKPALLSVRPHAPPFPTCPGFSLFLSPPLSLSLSLSHSMLLPESSAISEFDATSAIRYRPRKSDCSLWSRNNCAGPPPSVRRGRNNGERFCATRKGGEGRNRGRARANVSERERERRWMDEEKEADDDDGCKGGCPSSFSSAAAVNPFGDSARQLSADCRSLPLEKPRSKLNAERFLIRALLQWTPHLKCFLRELESGILSPSYVKPREINFKMTRRGEEGLFSPPAAAAGDGGGGGSCFTLFDFFKIYSYRFLAKSLSGRNLRSGNNTEGASPGELQPGFFST
ncbi:hypothetical protein ALC62_05634, partial [Cyphomyrmex costatus]